MPSAATRRSHPRRLTPKHALFAAEYVVDLNAAQAAIRAGYAAKRADAIGWDLLRLPEIAAAVAAEMENRAQRINRNADDVLKDLGLVRADAMAVVDGSMLDRPSAIKTLELEGRHLAMFTDKIAVSGEMLLRNMLDADLDAKLQTLIVKAGR